MRFVLYGMMRRCCSSRLPVLLLVAAGVEAVGDVPVGQVLEDPLGEGEGLHLVRGHRVAQDGAAQVAQAGHRLGSPPEPHMAIPGSGGGGGVSYTTDQKFGVT